MLIAGQLIMVATLVLMVSGRTPLYSTAILGSALAALVGGVPIASGADVTLKSLVIGGLNPVIADMAGVLMFIGAMEKSGYLQVIINAIIRSGSRLGGGAGVAMAGGVAAGVIGGFTGFTQPAITAAVSAALLLAAGQIHAVLALVEQQRIANIIALGEAWPGETGEALERITRDEHGYPIDHVLNPEIAEALGIHNDEGDDK